jgi:hypothetical protein
MFSSRKTWVLLLLLLSAVVAVGCSDDDDNGGMGPPGMTSFVVRIENTSSALAASGEGTEKRAVVPFAPGVWAVSDQVEVLFGEGQPDRGEGLEALAEDGNPATLASALASNSGVLSSGAFDTPVGESGPAPIGPGQAYEFTIEAEAGSYLSFATMYVQSNDLFVGPGEMGVELFDVDDDPVSGDITPQLLLLDAGTEINEEPGSGAHQAPRQAGPNTGPSEGVVQPVQDGWTYPSNGDVFSVMVSSESTEMGATFTVRIEVAAGSTTPLAPGIWAVHTGSGVLFEDGEPDRGDGLEALSEDGSPAGLAVSIPGQPGVIMSGVFDTPVGEMDPGPIGPGGAYEFTLEASEGSSLTFATMFVQSNDLFYAPDEDGIELFDSEGNPLTGDITDMLDLWDAGTEINEEPGVGPNQAPRQSGPNTGPTEGIVQEVSDGYAYEIVEQLIRVTLTPQ